MVTYLDTQSGGVNNDLTQGGTFEWPLNLSTEFWLNVANNLIPGQATGQAVTFKIQDIRGSQSVTVQYGHSISRKVRGHLVSTVPPTLPASPNADLHIILDDDQVPLEVNLIGQVTGSGSTNVSLNITFNAGVPVTVYTAPPGFKFYIVTMYVDTSDHLNDLWINRAANPNLQDVIFLDEAGPISLGQGPKNTVVLQPSTYLNPGDSLYFSDVTVSGAGGTINLAGTLQPL